MADQDLLKYARTRNDTQLSERIAAALMLEALYRAGAQPDQSVEAVTMTNWILDNPLQPIPLMTAFVSTMPEVAAKVTLLEPGGVETAEVLDSDIKYQVGAKWETVAAKSFTG